MGGIAQKRRGSSAPRERLLGSTADGQHGLVTHKQLIELGFSARSIERRLESLRLRVVHQGVYAVGHSSLSRRATWLAAVLAYGAGAVLSHRSAAALWGFAEPARQPIDVTAPVGWQGRRRRSGIWIHRCRLHAEHCSVKGDIPVTTVARTLFDLSEVVGARRLRSAWEEADRLHFLDVSAVEQVCELGFGRRALRPIRRLLAESHSPALTRSALEDLFVAFCREHRLPSPVTNTTVLGMEVDALWPTQLLIVELDGFAFHRHRAAFERDRARDAALLAAGYRVLRLTYRRLQDEPGAIVAQLRRLLDVSEIHHP